MGSPLPDMAFLFETAARTHPGLRGDENQDSHLAGTKAGIWAVADGMGGHTSGSQASQALIAALQGIPPQDSAALLLRACEDQVLKTNAALARVAAESDTIIGTTLAAFLAHGMHYACIWAGDSRIYRVEPHRAVMISRDHTEVQELVDRGLLSEREGRNSPRRNVITRAVGTSEDVELEMAQGVMHAGDTFLLCSDGLTNHVSDLELCTALADGPPEAACEALIKLALQRGGGDNITVVIARYLGPSNLLSSDTTVLMGPRA